MIPAAMTLSATHLVSAKTLRWTCGTGPREGKLKRATSELERRRGRKCGVKLSHNAAGLESSLT